MFELPIVYAVILFGLGFLAGVISTSLVHEFRRRPEAEAEVKPSSSEAKMQPEATPQAEPNAGRVNEANTLPESSSPSPIKRPEETVEWIPGPDEPAPTKNIFNPMNVLVRSMKSNPAKETPETMGMAEAIDEILQEKLVSSDLAGRNIRIASLPDQSLDVIVDGAHFSGVGEITDPAARALIQSAVAEWQRRANQTKK